MIGDDLSISSLANLIITSSTPIKVDVGIAIGLIVGIAALYFVFSTQIVNPDVLIPVKK